jgi:hypothetical protein
MLQCDTIKALAEICDPQDVLAALLWQRGQYNELDGPQVVSDLAAHAHLWRSFLFTTSVYAPDPRGASFCGLMLSLRLMADFPLTPASDTLYLLAENQDTIAAQLLDFGKKWEASTVHIFDGVNGPEDWTGRERLRRKLSGELFDPETGEGRDAIVIKYWWD